MGIPAAPVLSIRPPHFGSSLAKLSKAATKLIMLAAVLYLFSNMNMALGASFVLQNGQQIEGEIIYASASSVIIQKSDGATAQLGRHTIERVKLATDSNAMLEGVLESWKKGVYEISNDSGVFKIKARRIISKRQISSQELAVTATKKKQQDNIIATTEEKQQEAAVPTTQEKQQDAAVAATEEKQQEVATSATEEKQQEIAASTTEEKQQEITVATVAEKENAKELVFKLGLSRPAKQKVLLIYSTEDGSALAGFDYEAKRGSVVLHPGTREVSISVTLLDDDLAEGDETFGLLVTSDLDLAAVKVNRGSATILDNEEPAAKQ